MSDTSIFVLGVFNETAFYVLGICLAVLAIGVTAVGLRSESAFSSKLAMRGGLLIFAVLVVGTVTFAVRHSRDDQAERRAELAAEEAKAEASPAPQSSGSESPSGQSAVKGPGGTVKLAADPTQIAYVQKSLTSKPGKVTIDFDNPSQIGHDVAVEQGSQEIAKTPVITGSKTSVSAELAPGKYVFFCTVPGHREAGMQGTLTVK